MAAIPRFPAEATRSSRRWRLAVAASCPALLAVAFLALPRASGGMKQPSASNAPRTEVLAETNTDRSVKSVGQTSSERGTAEATNYDLESIAEVESEDEDEEADRLEDRLSAEILLLENRRLAHDRLETSANSDRLGAAERAALDARRAALSEKLAVHEQRVERLKQEIGSAESGYEAQNGMQ